MITRLLNFIAAFGLATALSTAAEKPNIILFYTDDHGYADFGLSGVVADIRTPLNVEKGMLAEGGMHVPFVVAWPGTIPGGQNYDHPVSALNVAATVADLAGIETKPGDLDGVNLIPHLKGDITTPPHEALYWRWTAQSATREGNWKLLRGGEREYLYDLSTDLGEKRNLAAAHPEIAERMRGKLTAWCDDLNPAGLALSPMAATWNDYFDHYLEGKSIANRSGKNRKPERRRSAGRHATEPSQIREITLNP